MTERVQELTSGVKTRHRTNVRAMCSTSFLKQVKRSSKSLIYLFYLIMLIGPRAALPSRPIILQTHNQSVVIFRNQPCRPVDRQHLSTRMGKFFDESRMALDEATVKRSVLQQKADDLDLDDDDDSDIDNVDDYSEKLKGRDLGDDDDDDDDDLDDLKQDEQQSTVTIHPFTTDPRHPDYESSQKFMRRKRDVDLEEGDIDNDRGADNKSQYQRLMESKSMNKQLKKFVKKSRRLKKVKKLPWACKMNHVWLKMEQGYFPPYVRSAECRSKRCFFNLYECIPKKYTIKILKRDPNRCNPVPTLGANTTYEEMWIFERFHVTVWCECGNSRSNRRRGRLRKGKKFRSRP
ncbi:hypothetical protein FSP39_011973 [Pinctada imbricata]|uniref:Protein trunk n=1 Tax=Pinctada imbricata TaxID=66713 RepID=A0AA88XRN4_PINIB|nr:hypothetical protein FSP39_011973 [Pinctada imbricata]